MTKVNKSQATRQIVLSTLITLGVLIIGVFAYIIREAAQRRQDLASRGCGIGGSKDGGGWKWVVVVLILASALTIGACMTPNDEQAELEWIDELYSQGYDWAHVGEFVREHPTGTSPNSDITWEQASANFSSISRLQEGMISHRQGAPGCLKTWGVRTSESLVGLAKSFNVQTGESSPMWDGSFRPREAADSLDRCSDRVRLRMEDDVMGLFANGAFSAHLNWYEKKSVT